MSNSTSQSPPPPSLTVMNSNQQQQINMLSTATNPPPPLFSSSTSSSTPTSTSIVIVIIVIASAIIISASLYLLLRFLSRRFHSTTTPPPILHHPHFTIPKHNLTTSISSLPLFSFNSLPANISGADCAVCLSRFEPHDQLRLLPLCCHAFHADCIDTWLLSNMTCPLCRSTVLPSHSDALDKILPTRTNSFRVEFGSVSRRRSDDDVSVEAVRSYTIGSFEYVVDEEVEVPIGDARTHRRDVSDKDSTEIEVSITVAPGDELAADVAVERGSWLRDYVDRIATVSSRSFRSSGRFFGGSSRRSNAVVGVDDLEANSRFGEEITELFQWLSRV